MIKRIFKIIFYSLAIIFILFSVIPYFISVENREQNDKPYSNSHFWIEGKTRIHYRVWNPEGEVRHHVLFIHGFAGSDFSFRKNIDTLVSLGAQVVAIDLPAFGFSDKSDSADYSMENLFKAINHILDKTDSAKKWDVVGHSMGAAVSGTYASNFPERIHTVTLIDGVPVKFTASAWITNLLLRYPPTLRWADVVCKHYFVKPEKFKELLASAYSSEPDSADVGGYIKPYYYKNAGSAVFRMAAAINKVDVHADVLEKLPVTVIWGVNDKWLDIKNMIRFMKEVPTAKGHIIQGAGHCPMETHAGEVNLILAGQVQS